MIKTVHYTFILACFSLFQVNGQVVDTIGKTHYYDHEIFWGSDLNLYNNWVQSRVLGGMSGDGFEPSFDRMEIMPYGIFKLFNKDTLLNFGYIKIEESNDPYYGQIISFNQDTVNERVEFADWFTFFQVDNETLDITEYCRDCYRYLFESYSPPPVLVSTSDLQQNSGQLIYPNPARDFLNIRLNGSAGHCEILSMQGLVVLSEAIGESRININTIPSGMYIVKIKTADKIYSQLMNIIE